MKPLVSVIMPSYNAEKYIGKAIESIICQTYENWELIIVEDKSTDATPSIIRSFVDKRIKVIYNECNQGIAYSTNKGIEQSRGKYIALLDDDDLAEKNRLHLQVDYMEKHSEIDILGGRTTFIDDQGDVIDYSSIPRNNPKYIKAVLLFNCMDFMNGTAMIRKDFIEKNHLYYRDGCYGMQDFLFYIESSKVGNISTINKFLLSHRIHSDNATNHNMIVFKERRAEVYAQFQKYSLWKSGFRLDNDQLLLLNKALAETNGRCDSICELQNLYKIFQSLLRQARKMKIDYYDEMNHICRVKISDQIVKMKELFSYDIF